MPSGELSGLTVVPDVEMRPGKVLPMLRWGYVLSSSSDWICSTTHLPFWLECVSLITLMPNHEALDSSSLALTYLDFPLRMTRFRLPVRGACVACIPPVSLLTIGVAGVRDPFTWGQWDRIHWERVSSPLDGVTS